ncbi:hypothetical protein L1987_23622 [Smallanthus sonchifolius]|uniref:Uncharacterized protein n=1 Tax=Smallanthus sonchifolius TaxID=185202 RepID=A0ACB9IJ24_9ASTR|nr:hypothetical protein L1987_23622 [Smallanthus sonchifolius]
MRITQTGQFGLELGNWVVNSIVMKCWKSSDVVQVKSKALAGSRKLLVKTQVSGIFSLCFGCKKLEKWQSLKSAAEGKLTGNLVPRGTRRTWYGSFALITIMVLALKQSMVIERRCITRDELTSGRGGNLVDFDPMIVEEVMGYLDVWVADRNLPPSVVKEDSSKEVIVSLLEETKCVFVVEGTIKDGVNTWWGFEDGTGGSYVDKLWENNSGLKTCFDRIWIPRLSSVLTTILDEAHKSKYSIHPGATKIFYDLRYHFWWPGTRREVVKYVEGCLTCLRVMAEHQKPYGKLQPLEIPLWKWENIAMDLITKLPKTRKGYDAIWVVVDRLTNSA